MLIRSPPTSRAIAARSSVVATTVSLPWARPGSGHAARTRASASTLDLFMLIGGLTSITRHCPGSGGTLLRSPCARPRSKRMRPMCANRELELEQQLVGGRPVAVRRPPVLAAHLAELAGPVGQYQRSALVDDRRIDRARRAIVAAPHEPPAGELVIGRGVVPRRGLQAARLIAAAPDHLGPTDEGAVDGPLERTPTERPVESPERGRQRAGACGVQQAVVPACVRDAKIDVRVVGDVLVRPQMADVAHLA